MIGRVRLVAGLAAAAGGAVLLSVAMRSQSQDTALAAAGGVALVLVVAASCLGPLVARAASIVPGRLVARISPVGGFLATAATRTAPRGRVASAMTPLVLSVAMACTLFSGTTQDTEMARASGGLPHRHRADRSPEAAVTEARLAPGVAAAVGIAPTGIVPLENAGIGSGYTSLTAQTVDAEGASARSISASARGR